jgi:O-succinylbenzoate synthase
VSATTAGAAPAQRLDLRCRPFAFRLPVPLLTAAGRVEAKRGWLLRLESADGALGWGEAAPLDPAELPVLAAALADLAGSLGRADLERALPGLPPALAFALGAALAEIDGAVGGAAAGGWLAAPPPAWLLPAGAPMLEALGRLPAGGGPGTKGPGGPSLTVKWKVAAVDAGLERRLLERLLAWLPAEGRLRLDANGGWDRATAAAWADRLEGEARLEWLEQPLAPDDQEGLERLGERIAVALDESLVLRPELRGRWDGWQVRRPSQEGDPRPLLAQLGRGVPRLVLSTAFETGIAARWTAHLAALQGRGPTPAAPGLAPGWRPDGPLFASEPERVWASAA